jgi:hypothetical protein
MSALNEALAELLTPQPALAQALQRLANEFEYETLAQLLSCPGTESGP